MKLLDSKNCRLVLRMPLLEILHQQETFTDNSISLAACFEPKLFEYHISPVINESNLINMIADPRLNLILNNQSML